MCDTFAAECVVRERELLFSHYMTYRNREFIPLRQTKKYVSNRENGTNDLRMLRISHIAPTKQLFTFVTTLELAHFWQEHISVCRPPKIPREDFGFSSTGRNGTSPTFCHGINDCMVIFSQTARSGDTHLLHNRFNFPIHDVCLLTNCPATAHLVQHFVKLFLLYE
jgi:hypothetical protein